MSVFVFKKSSRLFPVFDKDSVEKLIVIIFLI